MSKAKSNPFDDIYNSNPAPAAVSAPEQQHSSLADSGEMPPAKTQASASDIKMSTYRLTESDYRLLKGLAARDGMKLNDIIYEALRQYCRGRGIELTGSV